jgi:hypothetical protein
VKVTRRILHRKQNTQGPLSQQSATLDLHACRQVIKSPGPQKAQGLANGDGNGTRFVRLVMASGDGPCLPRCAAGLGSQEMPGLVWIAGGPAAVRVEVGTKRIPECRAVPGNPLSGRRAGVLVAQREGHEVTRFLGSVEMILGDLECQCQFRGWNCHALAEDMAISHQGQYSCWRQQHDRLFVLFLAANWRLEIL